MLKEIERILKNCTLRDEQVTRLIRLRYRISIKNIIDVYRAPSYQIVKTWTIIKSYLTKLVNLITEAKSTRKWTPEDHQKLLEVFVWL